MTADSGPPRDEVAPKRERFEVASIFLAYLLVQGYGYAKGVHGLGPANTTSGLDLDLNEYIVLGWAHMSNILPSPRGIGSQVARPVGPLFCFLLLLFAPYVPDSLRDPSRDFATAAFFVGAMCLFLSVIMQGIFPSSILITIFYVLFVLSLVTVPIVWKRGGWSLPGWLRTEPWSQFVVWLIVAFLFLLGFSGSYEDGLHDYQYGRQGQVEKANLERDGRQ